MTAVPIDWAVRVSAVDEADIVDLLTFHFNDMHAVSPPGTCHVLDLDSLRVANITVWGLWVGDALAGTVALKDHGGGLGEVKSMRTHPDFTGQGIARHLLEHLIDTARGQAMTEIKLETGTSPAFEAATRLYVRYGFKSCPPFAAYKINPHSLFMALRLSDQDA